MDAISGSGLRCVQMRRLSWENVKGLRHLLSGGKGYFEEATVNISYRIMHQCQVLANIQGLSLILYFLFTIVRYWIFSRCHSNSFKVVGTFLNLFIFRSPCRNPFFPPRCSDRDLLSCIYASSVLCCVISVPEVSPELARLQSALASFLMCFTQAGLLMTYNGHTEA